MFSANLESITFMKVKIIVYQGNLGKSYSHNKEEYLSFI